MITDDYTINSTSDDETKLLFEGPFNGQTVTWQTHLITCKFYKQLNNIANKKIKQFIDIAPAIKDNHYEIMICLNINRITKAEILKTIIMIRQYKNLAIGRHEFG